MGVIGIKSCLFEVDILHYSIYFSRGHMLIFSPNNLHNPNGRPLEYFLLMSYDYVSHNIFYLYQGLVSKGQTEQRERD